MTHQVSSYTKEIEKYFISLFQKFEKTYMKELHEKKCVSAKTQFEYAWCLGGIIQKIFTS